jgi:hypothetical protein
MKTVSNIWQNNLGLPDNLRKPDRYKCSNISPSWYPVSICGPESEINNKYSCDIRNKIRLQAYYLAHSNNNFRHSPDQTGRYR